MASSLDMSLPLRQFPVAEYLDGFQSVVGRLLILLAVPKEDPALWKEQLHESVCPGSSSPSRDYWFACFVLGHSNFGTWEFCQIKNVPKLSSREHAQKLTSL